MVASRYRLKKAGQTTPSRPFPAAGLALICGLAAVLGCGDGGPPPAPLDIPTRTATQPPAESPAETVDVKVLDYDGIRMLIDSHRGKVVVVDYWSTTCPPCLKEFPGLVRLNEKYPRDQLRCISVSLDYIGRADKPPESYKKKVLTYLETFGATFDNVIAGDEIDVMYEKLDLVAPPAVDVYRQDGTRARRFDNVGVTGEAEPFTYEDVEELVRELLDEAPAE